MNANIAALAPFLSLILIIGGLGALGYGAYRYYMGKQSFSWKKTQGTVVSADIKQTSMDAKINRAVSGDKYAVKNYFVTITYQYKHGGKEYTSNALKPGEYGMGADSQSDAKRLTRQFPAGTPLTVYFNPAKPEQAVLKPASDAGSFAFFGVLGVICVGIGLVFAVVV